MKLTQHLDTRRANQEGLYPVKIRVSHKRKEISFATGVFLSKRDFAALSSGPIRDRLDKQQKKIQEAVDSMPVFDTGTLRALIDSPQKSAGLPTTNNVLDWFEYKAVESIRVRDSHSTAVIYRAAAKFYYKYFKKDPIPFQMISQASLYDIQRTLIVDYSISTIGKYARHLRAVFNLAIVEGFIPRSLYPFGIHRYVPPTSRKRKNALTKEALTALINYEPETARERYHLDLFFFSFFGNGLNLKDVAMLRFKDIGKYYIVKQREKTRNSNQEPIKVYLIQQLVDIIDRSGNKDRSPNNYVFPLLKKSWSSERQFIELRNLRGRISRTLTGIAKKLGIEGKLPHGTSRHCFANALKQAGAPTELISEAIGHSSTAVTKHYTSDFEEAGITYQAYLLKYTGK